MQVGEYVFIQVGEYVFMWVVFWSGHFPDFCFTFFTFENQKAFDETVTLPPADHQKLQKRFRDIAIRTFS